MRSIQIHLSAKHPAQSLLHSNDVQEGMRHAWFEADRYADIAIGSEIIPKRRTEQRQLGDLATLEKGGEPVRRQGDAFAHG